MRTLDVAWQQFIDNTKASLKVTLAGITELPDAKRVLAGQLAVCEAVAAHAGIIEFPNVYGMLVLDVRHAIRSDQWGQLELIATNVDGLVGRMWALQSKAAISSVAVDAWSALVWVGRSTLLLAAGLTDKANESSNNTLDAVARVVIVTGHLRSDLMRLLQEVGVMRRFAGVTQPG